MLADLEPFVHRGGGGRGGNNGLSPRRAANHCRRRYKAGLAARRLTMRTNPPVGIGNSK